MIDPILITGCARSGTSMSAGIIDICGAYGGRTAGGNKNNPKGMFENTEIRNGLIKPYLFAMNVDPLGQNPLPDIDRLEPYNSFRGKVQTVMKDHGYKAGPWYYKGAKMCLIWPVINHAFPHAKWVIVRREDDGIINSCLKTGFMRKREGREGWQEWIDEHKLRFKEMSTGGLHIREVWPSKFIEGDFSEIKECIEWLGLEWKDDAVKEFIDPTLFGRAT